MDPDDPQLTTTAVERRQYRRVRLATQVECKAPECSEVRVSRDVSVGGMFFDVRFPLPLGSELSIAFRLSPAGASITCRAKVTFSRVGSGMGIQFLDLSAEAQQMLQRFVDEAA